MTRVRSRAVPWLWIAALAAAVLIAIALGRGGVLGLPRVPRDVTAARAGLGDLAQLRARAARLALAATAGADPDSVLLMAGRGIAAVQHGDPSDGLASLRRAVELEPRDLVIGNAYRMASLQVRRARLEQAPDADRAAGAGRVMADDSPIAPLAAVCQAHPSREATLQLALAWVDELMLHPALEIKAPASIESVTLLTRLLTEEPDYVPALYGRGLNYLYRPARLEWPEPRKAAPDAASRDLGLCVAIGQRIGGAPPQLVATLALSLGDALAKEGRPERARSWWQIAQNASHDSGLRETVRRRFGWGDDELLDRLEAEQSNRMLDLDHPLTDLSLMWQESP